MQSNSIPDSQANFLYIEFKKTIDFFIYILIL